MLIFLPCISSIRNRLDCFGLKIYGDRQTGKIFSSHWHCKLCYFKFTLNNWSSQSSFASNLTWIFNIDYIAYIFDSAFFKHFKRCAHTIILIFYLASEVIVAHLWYLSIVEYRGSSESERKSSTEYWFFCPINSKLYIFSSSFHQKKKKIMPECWRRHTNSCIIENVWICQVVHSEWWKRTKSWSTHHL